MERTKALAVASAATLVLGSGILAVASVTGAPFLGFGGTLYPSSRAAAAPENSKPGVVVRTRNVYDRYVIDTGNGVIDDGTSRRAPASPGGANTPGSSEPTTAGPEPDTETPIAPPTTSPRPAEKPRSATPTTRPGAATAPPELTPTTPAPSPPTTLPATTPTTWPLGVPKDWPKDKPIPPMPPNCSQPQLEDNGVWNCDH